MERASIPDLVAGFQKAVVDVLTHKTFSAAKKYGMERIFVSGGVAANRRLRKEFFKLGSENDIRIYIPPVELCMDNAAMVGCLGYHRFKRGLIDDFEIDVYSRSDL